ncbi:hypothetical protein ACIQUS_09775 [Pseudomonas sp. NPDC090755]|uniref:hypothetical protein n=1 Tax=Pseudomonas sp. NPDC090755 TaxID=3364481 RepID=UPI00383BC9E2
MKKYFLLSACLAVASFQVYGESIKCKCNKVPFEPDPPCAKACIASIIRYSDFEKLVTNADLSRDQQYAIFSYRLGRIETKAAGIEAKRDYDVVELNQVQVKLFHLPSDQLKRIVKTVPVEFGTVLVPSDKIMYYEFDRSLKKK